MGIREKIESHNRSRKKFGNWYAPTGSTWHAKRKPCGITHFAFGFAFSTQNVAALNGNIGVCTKNGMCTENFVDVWTSATRSELAASGCPSPRPKLPFRKTAKKSTSLSYFSACKTVVPAYHTFHHNFTTKAPHADTPISKNPAETLVHHD
jgi:hypothetical protein